MRAPVPDTPMRNDKAAKDLRATVGADGCRGFELQALPLSAWEGLERWKMAS